jgi:glycosyltransferase involved in cell wall biosynthesis
MKLVSVVIPTYRRPLLAKRAVQSVLAQTYQLFEVIVVIDGVDDGTRVAIDSLGDGRTRVLETGRNQGPAEARNFGVRAAHGFYVAILDDDDEWTYNKLERQLRFIGQHGLEGQDFLLSCRTILRDIRTGKTHLCPAVLYQTGDDLSEYILDRPSPFKRAGIIASGTLLFPRTLALRVPFPNDAVHEDWSWLLFCVMRDGVALMMCDEPMFVYNLDTTPSRNILMDWHKSLEWGRQYRQYMSGKAFAGLLSTTTAWRAKRQHGLRAVPEIVRAMRREGNAGLNHWLMFIGVMLFPAGFAERLRQRSLRWTNTTVANRAPVAPSDSAAPPSVVDLTRAWVDIIPRKGYPR